MRSSDRADIHRIYVLLADILGNVVYIIFHFRFWYDRCDHTGKSTAVYAAHTVVDLL